MNRRLPKLERGAPVAAATPKTVEIHVVTPLFGGGAKAGEVDETMLVRGSSIRGHLRFWWRALRGGAFSKPADLLKAENEIFGATDKASPLRIRVEVKDEGRPIRRQQLPRREFPEYAIFPFRTLSSDVITAQESLSFRLLLTYPKTLEMHYRDALWAWINFGGLGARTRRGCGALWCGDFSPRKAKDLIGLASNRFDAGPGKGRLSRPWPLLGWSEGGGVRFRCLISREPIRCIEAWKSAVKVLQDFRGSVQRRRSEWPEAETIREFFDNKFRSHRSQSMPEGFPRAEFGLPIIFQFKDEKKVNNADPPDTELKPREGDSLGERMASPLILKPLATSQTRALPMILRLNTPPLRTTALFLSKKNARKNAQTRRHIGAAGIGKMVPKDDKGFWCGLAEGHIRSQDFEDLEPMNGHDSALDAFWEFAKDKGFTEVEP